jgi:hypothetical protein
VSGEVPPCFGSELDRETSLANPPKELSRDQGNRDEQQTRARNREQNEPKVAMA